MKDPKKLAEYAKEKGAQKMQKVNGPNGAFIVLIMPNGEKQTLPVGKRSQAGKLEEFNVLIAEDTQQAIATVNLYVQEEEVML